MMKFLAISVVFSVFLYGCSREAKRLDNTKKNKLEMSSSCDKLKQCVVVWENNRNNNSLINKLIPEIEKETGIEASCKKGTYGYLYNLENDSVFYRDVEKWAIKLNCNVYEPSR